MVSTDKYSALNQSESTRDQIVKAAMLCMIQYGPKRANISSIASIAGVSRPTVYAHFENIDDLLKEAIIDGTRLLCMRLLVHVEAIEDPRERLIEAFMELLSLSDEIDLLRDPVDHAIRIGSGRADDGSIMSQAIEVAMAIFTDVLNGPMPSDRSAEEMAETTIRLFLSLAELKRPESADQDMRSYLRRTLLPAIGM